MDYIPGPYHVTFPTGQNNISFDIQINDDGIPEPNKTFTLYIDQDSLPNRVLLNFYDQATVSIIDTQCK